MVDEAPDQELAVTAGWLTTDDPECCAVRSFSERVALTKTKGSGSGTSSNYQVVSTTKSWLGVDVAIPGDSTNLMENPVVLSVDPKGPAKGLLQPGDRLVSVAGVKRPPSSDLGPPVIDEVASQLPGRRVALTIQRGTATQVVNITLAMGPTEVTATRAFPSPGYAGVQVTTVSTALRQQFGLTSGGAFVKTVAADAPAHEAGIDTGDVITSVGVRQIINPTDFEVAMMETPPGTTVKVALVNASGVPETVTMTVGSYPETAFAPQVTSM